MRFQDITGQMFGQLLVICQAPTVNKRTYWKCECECGNETIAEAYKLKIGHTASCGCARSTVNRMLRLKHGESDTRLYRIWRNMKSRCLNPSFPAYATYGAIGRDMCPQWVSSYEMFAGWAKGAGYADNLTIERIDNNKGYWPDNCTWIPKELQARNTRTNVLTADAAQQIRTMWKSNIPQTTIAQQMNISQSLVSDVICQKVWRTGWQGVK